MNAWVWAIWLAIVLVSFAALEGYALRHPERQWTLSRTISDLGKRWPLSIALLGMLFGGLLVHFYWPWQSNPLAP